MPIKSNWWRDSYNDNKPNTDAFKSPNQDADRAADKDGDKNLDKDANLATDRKIYNNQDRLSDGPDPL